MAGGAEAHEVAGVMSATFSKRNFVMHFLGGGGAVILQAHLTQGMVRQMPRPDFPPEPAVLPLGCWIAPIPVVIVIGPLFMRGAEPFISKLRTARIAARALGLPGHTHLRRA